MAKLFDSITPELQEFISRQAIFFVATAPLAASGHINLSPKGLDTFRLLSPTKVAYLDLTGSGNETAAHVAENGRITFMFCSFDASPRILRLYGAGRTAIPGDAEWDDLAPLFPSYPGVRQIVVADLEKVHTSCGFGVPRMELSGERDALPKWAEAKGEGGLDEYRRANNARSIDGLAARLREG